MTTIELRGEIADVIGSRFEFQVDNLSEAFRALNYATKGEFVRYLSLDKGVGKYALELDGVPVNPQQYADYSVEGKTVLLSSSVEGSNNNRGKSVALIVVAVVLIALTYGGGSAAGGAAGGGGAGGAGGGGGSILMNSGLVGAKTNAYLGMVGVSLGLSGVMGLLTPSPKSGNEQEKTDSSSVTGNLSTISTGAPVPVGYGRRLVDVSSNIISLGIRSIPTLYSGVTIPPPSYYEGTDASRVVRAAASALNTIVRTVQIGERMYFIESPSGPTVEDDDSKAE